MSEENGRRKVLLVLILVIALLALFALARVVIINQDKESFVAEIANEKISIEEYLIYLYEQELFFEDLGGSEIWEMDFDGQSPRTLAKERAFESLVYIKVAVQQAERMGLSLTDAERQSAWEQASQFFQSLEKEGYEAITFEDVLRVMEETELFRKLYEEVTKNFAISELELNRYYEEYWAENQFHFDKVFVSYIYVEGDDQKITDALTALENGSPFKEVASKYSDDYNEKVGLAVVEVTDVFPPEVMKVAYDLAVGETSGIIQAQNGSYILIIHDRILAERETIKQQGSEIYIEMRTREFYETNYQAWREVTNITKNESLLGDL